MKKKFEQKEAKAHKLIEKGLKLDKAADKEVSRNSNKRSTKK